MSGALQDWHKRARRYSRLIPSLFEPAESLDPSVPPVEVFIPVIAKDLAMLPHTVTELRRHLLHPIRRVQLLAPDQPEIRAAADRLECEWVNEASVFGFTKAQTPLKRNGYELSGWLFQQFLKWAEHLSREEFYFVIDADTALNRPQAFRRGGKTLLLEMEEPHPPYRETYRELFGREPAHGPTFVAHQMLFERSKVREIRAEIESRAQGRSWTQAILEVLSRTPSANFSEYETYGQWLLERYPRETETRYWSNLALDPVDFGKPQPAWKRPILSRCRSISWHHYSLPREL